MTIMVSTPYMDEAGKCDRIALFQDGDIMKIAGPDKIIADLDIKLYSATSSDRYELMLAIKDSGYVSQAYLSGQAVHFVPSVKDLEKLNNYLIDKGFGDVKIDKAEVDIEDCFINLMVK